MVILKLLSRKNFYESLVAVLSILNLRVDVDYEPIRLAALSWNRQGSFLFTSSSAPYDCNDNGLCNEVGLEPKYHIHSLKVLTLFHCF